MRPRILEARQSVRTRRAARRPFWPRSSRATTSSAWRVLDAFDGSFFKGRFYARQPEAMIDVGNDREFGFLYHPTLAELEAAFSPLLEAELPAVSRRRRPSSSPASSSCPAEVEIAAIQIGRSAAAVRSRRRRARGGAGRSSSELDLSRTEDDPEGRGTSPIGARSEPTSRRQAVLEVIGATSGWRPGPRSWVRSARLVTQSAGLPSLLPVSEAPASHDAEVVSLLLRDWPR